MTPNQITAARVVLTFAAVALFGGNVWANLAALTLTIGAIALDAADGYVARKRKLATPLGAQLDILGDRIVEILFFTFFAVAGLASLWVPVFFFVRGTLTDWVRSLAAREGRSAFGGNSMLESVWTRALVASRTSRAAYGALKCAASCWLGLALALVRSPELGGAVTPLVRDVFLAGCDVLVVMTVAFCLVRALPVLWEGRRYLAQLTPAVKPVMSASLAKLAGGTLAAPTRGGR
jgi:phosphatidylglycerophosphate synthase